MVGNFIQKNCATCHTKLNDKEVAAYNILCSVCEEDWWEEATPVLLTQLKEFLENEKGL